MAKRPAQTNEPKVVVKCKYAGDPNDEYCKLCSGCTMKLEDNGPDVPCTQCGGYEPEEEPVVNEVVEEPTNTVESPSNHEAAPQTEQEPTIMPEQPKVAQTPNTKVNGVTTEIKAESGVSCELVDKFGVKKWYKFTYSETRVVAPDCDLEAEKKALWDDVNGTVDDQIIATTEFLNK